MQSPNRRRFIRNWTALPLVAGGISGLIREALANGTNPVPPGLHKVSGQVSVNGQPGREGQLIKPGDTISTGPGSEAIYVVGRNAYLQREQSRVTLTGDSLADGLRILTGKLLAVFGKGAQRLETSTSTIGIRGTGCYIEAEPERTYICLCYGEADYQPLVAPEKSRRLATSHHEQPVWISGSDRDNPITPAPMLNHTDAELVLLENLVGRWPPFYGKGGPAY